MLLGGETGLGGADEVDILLRIGAKPASERLRMGLRD